MEAVVDASCHVGRKVEKEETGWADRHVLVLSLLCAFHVFPLFLFASLFFFFHQWTATCVELYWS